MESFDQPSGSQETGRSWSSAGAFRDERTTARLRVFVSSVSDGYQQYRAAVRRLVDALGHEPVLIGETSPALPRAPQRACLSAVAACDVMVLLLGAKYGTVQHSGRSATHEEWERARDLGKELLVFKERVKPDSKHQADFIREVRDYESGLSYKEFSTRADLQEELVRALRRVEEERRASANFARRLPEPVSSMLESMRVLFPDSLIRTERLLASAAADGPEGIDRLVEHPPVWATEPGPLVWESIAEFVDASGVAGGNRVRTLAIEAGSQRRSLYLALNAVAAAADGETDHGDKTSRMVRSEISVAEAIAIEIPTEDPLHAATLARIRRDPEEAINAVGAASLAASEDPAVCELAALLLAWAHCEKERPEEALAVLDTASNRHPDRPWLTLHQARLALGLGLPPDLGIIGKPDLLDRARGLAMEARDRLRELGGPSHQAVSVACQALAALEEPENALRVGRPEPAGEATRAEAAHPPVQQFVAEALLMLGRYSEIDQLELDSFDPWLRSMTRALQAEARGDPAAVRLMHKAHDEALEPAARKQVAFVLATLGERVDQTDLGLSDAEAALFSGVATLRSGDPDGAVEILRHHLPASQMHAYWLWRAQQELGETSAVIETLRAAVEQFGPDPLAADLVDRLVESGQSNEAESVAVDALARSTSRDVGRRLRTALVHMAEAIQDWHKVHEHAAALHRENPQHYAAAWAAVHALARQGRHDAARIYLRAHRLTPTSEEAAHLVVALLGGPTAPEVDAAGLLEIAKLFPQSEQVTGSVLVALMSGGERVNLTDEQRDTARELLEEFVERFPASEIVGQVRASSVQEQAELLRHMLRQRSSAIDWQLVDDVHAGRAPYGLLWAPDRPYASLLLGSDSPGAYLTALSADPETLEREIETARAAMGSAVVIDTSVAVLTSRTALSLDQLAGVFDRVFVPDQLLADASLAVARARTSGDATMWYESDFDRVAVREFSQQEKDRMVESAERVVAALQRRLRVPSGDARPQRYPDSVAEPFVWDAAVRVAAVRGCALWCDDAALRHLAETLGVTTFGTYALYEALDGRPARDALPDSSATKLDLLRARIADVPISWTDLADETDDSEGPDPAWDLWLSRPATWRDPAVVAGYTHRIRELEDRWIQHIPRLLHAACSGFGAVVVDSDRKRVVGSVLAGTLLELHDPTLLAADLVDAARTAAAAGGQRSQSDPLPAAAEILLAVYEAETDAAIAAQKLLSVFSSLSPADLRTVASMIGSIPNTPAVASRSKSFASRAHRRPRSRGRSQKHARRVPPRDQDAAAELVEALRTRRLGLDLTQQALADRCGMARARVSAVESGATQPRIGTVLRLARGMRSSLSLAPSSARSPSPGAGITSLHSLGRALRTAREELGWRQQDLSDRSGVNRAQISKIEAARSDPLTETVLRLTDAVGLVVRLDHDDDSAFELDDIIAAHSGPAFTHSGPASTYPERTP